MKKGMLFILFVLATVSTPAFSQSKHDWKKGGDAYSVTPNANGGVTARGRDVRNGKNWAIKIDGSGNMSGADQNSHRWSYDRSSKTYRSSDGTFCKGKVCNK